MAPKKSATTKSTAAKSASAKRPAGKAAKPATGKAAKRDAGTKAENASAKQTAKAAKRDAGSTAENASAKQTAKAAKRDAGAKATNASTKRAAGAKSASAKRDAGAKAANASTKRAAGAKSASAKREANKLENASAKRDAPKAPAIAVRKAPSVGSKAPSFTLPADDGSEVTLAGLAGKTIVLYFYPRDATPGCTIEACGFRDTHAALEKQGAVVLGVSRDSVASHAKFKAAQNLPFRLLSDPAGDTISAYGSWGEKSFMGRKSMGILRTTILIDGTGTIRKIYPKVATKTHAAEVLKDLAALE